MNFSVWLLKRRAERIRAPWLPRIGSGGQSPLRRAGRTTDIGLAAMQDQDEEHWQSEDDFWLDVYLGRTFRWGVCFLAFLTGGATAAGIAAMRGWW